MKIKLNSFQISIVSKKITIAVDFISDSSQYIKTVGRTYQFLSESIDEVTTLANRSSLPATPADGTLKEITSERVVVKYVSATDEWIDVSELVYFGNTLVNTMLKEFDLMKIDLSLPDAETLDYTDLTNYLNSVNYTQLGMKS